MPSDAVRYLVLSILLGFLAGCASPNVPSSVKCVSAAEFMRAARAHVTPVHGVIYIGDSGNWAYLEQWEMFTIRGDNTVVLCTRVADLPSGALKELEAMAKSRREAISRARTAATRPAAAGL